MVDWASKQNTLICFSSPQAPWNLGPGKKWRSVLVWDKGPAVGGGGDTARCWKQTWELIQVANNGPLNGSRDSAVLSFHVRPGSYHHHPTEKPITLMKYLIGKLTEDLIIDPFMGSGSTGIAAIGLGRKFIGVEIDLGYFEVAKRRIIEALSCESFLSGDASKATKQTSIKFERDD